jgi:hypothetical protein
MTLYCYRDLIDGENYEYFGCTLYFNWEGSQLGGTGQRKITDSFSVPRVFDLISALNDIVKGKGHNDAVRAIIKWVSKSSPIVQFFYNCIDSGTGQERCLALAKRAGIKYRRQNALGLYKILSLEREFQHEEDESPPSEKTVDPPYDLYEQLQEYFSDELELWLGLIYTRSELSECEPDFEEIDPDNLQHGDFVFEIGERKTATFRYWGHWHTDRHYWSPLKLFDNFQLLPLEKLLKEIPK